MIVYACMCEQTLYYEYMITLTLCVGAMQFSLISDESLFILHKTFFQIMIMFENAYLTF